MTLPDTGSWAPIRIQRAIPSFKGTRDSVVYYVPTGILGQSGWHSELGAFIPFILSGDSTDLHNSRR